LIVNDLYNLYTLCKQYKWFKVVGSGGKCSPHTHSIALTKIFSQTQFIKFYNYARTIPMYNAKAMPKQCQSNAKAMPKQCQSNAKAILVKAYEYATYNFSYVHSLKIYTYNIFRTLLYYY
jgi:hypothetical protein